jgi:hypothetical protein
VAITRELHIADLGGGHLFRPRNAPMMTQTTPPKTQSRSTSVEMKAIDLSMPGSILFAA